MAALVVGILFSCGGVVRGFHVATADRGFQWSMTDDRRWQQSACASRKARRETGHASSSKLTENAPGRSSPENSRGFGSRSSRRRRGHDKRHKPVAILKRSSRWACVKGCGACCYLAMDHRPDMAEILRGPQELETYASMTAEDGWCVHFDKENRACNIYDDRPRFCRVEADTFGEMYGVEPKDMDNFCTLCCSDQIEEVYGHRSKEMRVFKRALEALARGERPMPERNPFGGDEQAIKPRIRDWGLEENASDV